MRNSTWLVTVIFLRFFSIWFFANIRGQLLGFWELVFIREHSSSKFKILVFSTILHFVASLLKLNSKISSKEFPPKRRRWRFRWKRKVLIKSELHFLQTLTNLRVSPIYEFRCIRERKFLHHNRKIPLLWVSFLVGNTILWENEKVLVKRKKLEWWI